MQATQNILIVDRSELIVQRLEVLLKEGINTGSVFCVLNVQQALQVLHTAQINIILTDAGLPQMAEIIDAVSKANAMPPTVIIMMDNGAGKRDKEIAAGVKVYHIDKFGEFEEIVKIIKNIKQ